MNYKWIQLCNDMRATGQFYGPRLTPAFLSKNFNAGRAIVRRCPDSQLPTYRAYLAWLKTNDPRYVEIALAYVANPGNGILKDMMAELLAKLPIYPGFEDRDKYPDPPQVVPFLITKNRAMMHVALSFGFRVVTKFNMPHVEDWADDIGLGDRLPRSATVQDPHHAKRMKRWLMLRFYS